MNRVICAVTLLVCSPLLQGGAQVGSGKLSPDGKSEVMIDLPDDLQKRNIGSPRPNGPGCCVFRSIDHASRWQGVSALSGMPEWMADHQPVIPGGGYPDKVAKLIPRIAKERGLPTPAFLQVEGADLGVIRAALKTGRMVCNTYGYSPTPGRYGGKIAHMVNTVHGDETWFCVLDNNFPGSKSYQWMDPQTYRSVIGGAQAWIVVLLDPGPPLPPCN